MLTGGMGWDPTLMQDVVVAMLLSSCACVSPHVALANVQVRECVEHAVSDCHAVLCCVVCCCCSVAVHWRLSRPMQTTGPAPLLLVLAVQLSNQHQMQRQLPTGPCFTSAWTLSWQQRLLRCRLRCVQRQSAQQHPQQQQQRQLVVAAMALTAVVAGGLCWQALGDLRCGGLGLREEACCYSSGVLRLQCSWPPCCRLLAVVLPWLHWVVHQLHQQQQVGGGACLQQRRQQRPAVQHSREERPVGLLAMGGAGSRHQLQDRKAGLVEHRGPCCLRGRFWQRLGQGRSTWGRGTQLCRTLRPMSCRCCLAPQRPQRQHPKQQQRQQWAVVVVQPQQARRQALCVGDCLTRL